MRIHSISRFLSSAFCLRHRNSTEMIVFTYSCYYKSLAELQW